ncbi:MAG: hypothetical protein Q8O46_03300 [bacterium]|nr:hypothetical protein [bacterium]
MSKKHLFLVSFIILFVLIGSFSIQARATAVAVDIKANGSDGPVTLSLGQNLTLDWTSVNALYCSIGAPINSGVLTNGSAGPISPGHPFYPNSSGTNYVITCWEAFGGNNVTDSVLVFLAPVFQPVTVSLIADPISITPGQSTILNLSSTNADYCTMNGHNLKSEKGKNITSFIRHVFPEHTTTLTAVCYDSNNFSASQSVTIKVRKN